MENFAFDTKFSMQNKDKMVGQFCLKITNPEAEEAWSYMSGPRAGLGWVHNYTNKWEGVAAAAATTLMELRSHIL